MVRSHVYMWGRGHEVSVANAREWLPFMAMCSCGRSGDVVRTKNAHRF